MADEVSIPECQEPFPISEKSVFYVTGEVFCRFSSQKILQNYNAIIGTIQIWLQISEAFL